AATLVVSNVPFSMNNNNLVLIVTNAYGSATNAGTLLTVQTGPPVITTDIQASRTAPLVGMSVTFTVSVSGALPNYQWQLNGTNLADNGRIVGSKSNILTIVQALQSDA